MDHDYAQRRRVAVAIAVTVIAAPAAFLLNRSDADDALTTSAAVVAADGQPAVTTGEPAATTPLGTAPVGYLSGSTLPSTNEPARIAIPAVTPSIKGLASYSSTITSPTLCAVPGLPFNSNVTVTNLDNSRRVQCIASAGAAAGDVEIVLATDAFAQIADLTDAPIHIEITWVAPATIAPPVTQPTASSPATGAP